MIHTVKDFSVVNKAEVDVFLQLSCFLDDPADVGNLISGSSAFSKTSLNIWKFTVHILLKPSLEIFERYFTSLWEECNCAVQALIQAPALRLPYSEKAFQLFVHEIEGIALGVLTQRLGSEPQPVTYLSKRLIQGQHPCLRNLAAIAIIIEDALKLSFGGKLFLPATK